VAPRLKRGAQVLRAADTTQHSIAAVYMEKKRRVEVQKNSALLPHRTVGLEGENTVVDPHAKRPASNEETRVFVVK